MLIQVRAEVRSTLAAAERARGRPDEARRAPEEAIASLPGLPLDVWYPSDPCSGEDLEKALLRLGRLSPGVGRRFLDACAFAVHQEGTTTTEAAVLVRTCVRHLGVEFPESSVS